ncbi:hypothetical protein DERF_014901 [Dermatophagoides farinae]|uniref:Uncharacterized protein n=1 Tax=Dermatophagoides farinae TaxID=6954 RepID=A0A922HPY2_DERFA|nr:hypothetical protein DERF_014901 [Dermatophagoides farinae]
MYLPESESYNDDDDDDDDKFTNYNQMFNLIMEKKLPNTVLAKIILLENLIVIKICSLNGIKIVLGYC